MRGKYGRLNEVRRRIEEWQVNEYVHPLTCGNNSMHDNLITQLNKEGDVFELYLVCKECNWKQDVPVYLMS